MLLPFLQKDRRKGAIKMNDLEKKVHEFSEQIYNAGYEDGQKDKPSVFYEQYKKGLDDAWEYALKVGMYGCEYYKNNVFPKSPNYDVWDILRHYSASEAIAKIKEYEKGLNDISMGDEVYYRDNNHRFVVTALLDDKRAVLISANGKWITEYLSRLHKTGKHYSELEIMLDKLKGD